MGKLRRLVMWMAGFFGFVKCIIWPGKEGEGMERMILEMNMLGWVKVVKIKRDV
ncbi:hypothetical protein [Bacillus thuringiensis]|uniref:hypothetical protein n=1 Tax=Bacillus thuringiensis TaxID=1428 RepID=UPI0016432BEB|nr:hypothetical protein [Bacillus thuringiensis]